VWRYNFMNWIEKKMVLDMTSRYTKTLAAKEDRAVCNLIIAPGKIFTSYCQGMVALA